MNGKTRINWGGEVKEELVDLLCATLRSSMGENEQVFQIIQETIENFVPHRETQTRLYQVLEAHRGMKRDDGERALSSRTINLAQRIATQLPGEKFWLISAKEDGSIAFESDVAKVNVIAYE